MNSEDHGYILLEGGAEFGGRISEPDRRAIYLAGGVDAPIRIIPAAAAADNNHHRAGKNGERWFASLGAVDVRSLGLIDSESANRDEICRDLAAARLVYLLGGSPDRLRRALAGSCSWQAVVENYQSGGVVAGSSAGAMVLCQFLYDPYLGEILPGLGLLPNTAVLPHHNTFGASWAPQLQSLLPEVILIGIDESTGIINEGQHGEWRVYGQGAVAIYHHGQRMDYQPGEAFSLPQPG